MRKLRVKINGEKIVFDVPQSWDDISLEMACNLIDYSNSDKDDPHNFGILAVLLGVDISVIESIESDSFDTHVLSYLGYLSNTSDWEKIVKPDCPEALYLEDTDTVFPIKKDIGLCTLGQKENAVQVLMNDELSTYEKALEILDIYVNNKLIDSDIFKDLVSVCEAGQVMPIANFFLKQLVNIKKLGLIRSQLIRQAMNMQS